VPLSRSLSSGSTVGSHRTGAYRVVYNQQESLNGGTHHWEVLSVRRPFESADLVYNTTGPPSPADHPSSGSVSTEDRLYSVDDSGLHDVGGRQPGTPSGDQDLVTQLPDMLRRGLAHDTGQSQRVAGRSCRTYRLLEPPVGPIRSLRGPSEHDELCLDGDGLVLSETWTLDDRIVLQRTATAVMMSGVSLPPIAGASPPKGNTSHVVADADPHGLVVRPLPPPSFRAVSPVQFALPDPLNPSSPIATSVVWTYVGGADVVSVEAGQERPGQLPWQANDTITEPVQLVGLGPAQSAIRSDGAEIRVDLGGGRWVRVHGTIPLTTLVHYADALRLSAGPGAGD
jgi:hypothetical protein